MVGESFKVEVDEFLMKIGSQVVELLNDMFEIGNGQRWINLLQKS